MRRLVVVSWLASRPHGLRRNADFRYNFVEQGI
jgi:hypothetical protein